MRLNGKVAVVIGAGQGPGVGTGNGRATVVRFAQEGAKVLAVDSRFASAEETVAMAKQFAPCVALEADVTKEAAMVGTMAEAKRLFGRIDIMHFNVGVGLAGGDTILAEIKEDALDRLFAINLRGAIVAAKHVVPIMREQSSGVIINISSVSAYDNYPYVAYKATKAGLVEFTKQLAIQNAAHGIRANAILPGLIDTPMAVDTRVRVTGKSRTEIAAARDSRVPLRRKMGTAWDVANAAVFLASDEANFITGVALPVDGGAMVNIG